MSVSESAFDDTLKLRKNSVVFAEGDESSFMYLVKKGKVAIVKEDGKRIVVISVVGDQSLIGESSIFADTNRSATAVAIEPSELLVVKFTDVRKVLKDCPDWVSDLLKTLSDRLHGVSKILSEHNIANEELDDKQLTQDQINDIRKAIEDYNKKRS